MEARKALQIKNLTLPFHVRPAICPWARRLLTAIRRRREEAGGGEIESRPVEREGRVKS